MINILLSTNSYICAVNVMAIIYLHIILLTGLKMDFIKYLVHPKSIGPCQYHERAYSQSGIIKLAGSILYFPEVGCFIHNRSTFCASI